MGKKKYSVEKSEVEWQKALNSEQFRILRQAGTERPGSSIYNDFDKEGTYVCAGCNTELYTSENKFNAHCGWPSFDRAKDENIELDVDFKVGYERTELKCNTCGGHLGHVFNDGPKETTGQRHCLNGVALKFIPKS